MEGLQPWRGPVRHEDAGEPSSANDRCETGARWGMTRGSHTQRERRLRVRGEGDSGPTNGSHWQKQRGREGTDPLADGAHMSVRR